MYQVGNSKGDYEMPIPTERVYRGSGRPAVIAKRDKSRTKKTTPPISEVTTTYLNTSESVEHASNLFMALMERRLS